MCCKSGGYTLFAEFERKGMRIRKEERHIPLYRAAKFFPSYNRVGVCEEVNQ